MSNVLEFETQGLPPATVTAMKRLQSSIWDAIDQSAIDKLPKALVIGQLETIKAAILHEAFQSHLQGKDK